MKAETAATAGLQGGKALPAVVSEKLSSSDVRRGSASPCFQRRGSSLRERASQSPSAACKSSTRGNERRGSLKTFANSLLERTGSGKRHESPLARREATGITKPGSLKLLPLTVENQKYSNAHLKDDNQRSLSLPVSPVHKLPPSAPPSLINKDPESPSSVINALIFNGVAGELKARLRGETGASSLTNSATSTPKSMRKADIIHETMTKPKMSTSSSFKTNHSLMAMSSSESGCFDAAAGEVSCSSHGSIMDLKQVKHIFYK